MSDTDADPIDDRDRMIAAKVAWRLAPLLMLCYFVAFLDRVNIGFAALAMNADLGFNSAIFGFGAGVFFFGYFFFEVPSNLVLEKVGARVWIARIMFTWGLVSAATALVWNESSFYAARFLLGAAEAGFFPGVVLYLTYWFPAQHRAKMVGLFMAAVPVSGVVGAPLSGWLLGPRRHARPARLAVALHPRGPAFDAAERGGLAHPHGPAARRALADGG